jgi:hypothetical protein
MRGTTPQPPGGTELCMPGGISGPRLPVPAGPSPAPTRRQPQRVSGQLPSSGCQGGGRAQERDVGCRHRPGRGRHGCRRRLSCWLSRCLASGTDLPSSASAAGLLYPDAPQHTGSGSLRVVQKSCCSKRSSPSCVPSYGSPKRTAFGGAGSPRGEVPRRRRLHPLSVPESRSLQARVTVLRTASPRPT